MKREIRNPKSHRNSEANERRTAIVVEAYQGKNDIERTWDLCAPDGDHEYLIGLRKRVRNLKNYLLHRADPKVNI